MRAIWAGGDVVSGNARDAVESESEALVFVRVLLGRDWKADEPVMISDDSALAGDEVPPGVHGEELARHALAAADPVRRTT